MSYLLKTFFLVVLLPFMVFAQTASKEENRNGNTIVLAQNDSQDQTVYITRSGTKYHRAGCRYLSKSQIPISLKNAMARYSPCSACNPPDATSTTPQTSNENNNSTISKNPKENESSTTPYYSGRCKAITKKGTQCKRNGQPGSNYCWQHQR